MFPKMIGFNFLICVPQNTQRDTKALIICSWAKITDIFFLWSALKINENSTLRYVFSLILSPTENVDYF